MWIKSKYHHSDKRLIISFTLRKLHIWVNQTASKITFLWGNRLWPSVSASQTTSIFSLSDFFTCSLLPSQSAQYKAVSDSLEWEFILCGMTNLGVFSPILLIVSSLHWFLAMQKLLSLGQYHLHFFSSCLLVWSLTKKSLPMEVS